MLSFVQQPRDPPSSSFSLKITSLINGMNVNPVMNIHKRHRPGIHSPSLSNNRSKFSSDEAANRRRREIDLALNDPTVTPTEAINARRRDIPISLTIMWTYLNNRCDTFRRINPYPIQGVTHRVTHTHTQYQFPGPSIVLRQVRVGTVVVNKGIG